MFREEYIKANEQIRPDDVFLERLKRTVKQEDRVVHLGDYVDYENSEAFEVIGGHNDNVMDVSAEKKRRIAWKEIVAIVACFILVCTVAYTAGNADLFGNEQGLQAGMESLLTDMNETEIDEESVIDVERQKLYKKTCDLFATSNVVIYEVEGFPQNDSGMEFLNELKSAQCELSPAQRDELVGDIVAENYTLCDNCEMFSETKYYVAEFENDSYVYFAIDSDKYIFIEEVSGLQSLALIGK